MDLARRLAQLPPPVAPLVPEERARRIAALRQRLVEIETRSPPLTVTPVAPPTPPEPFGLPGARRDTPWGEVYVVDDRYDVAHGHGHARLDLARTADPARLVALGADAELGGVDPERMLFLDTETTGLHGGTGTLAFLIGLGFFDDGALSTEQLLLLRPGHEQGMLRRLAERLEAASAIVTYNGKAFDWPLLKTRFIINRVPMPPPLPHLDLLRLCRRLYCFRLSSCRLTEVEREILAMRREEDVAAAEIPERYWEFLRSGDGRELRPVLDHNADDVVALAALVGRLGHADGAGFDDPRIRLGLARVQVGAGALDLALATVHGLAPDAALPGRGWRFVGELERRRGQTPLAITAFERALATAELSPKHVAAVHLSLAKLYEHRLRDFARARQHAENTLRAEGPARQRRRLARLDRRLARAVVYPRP